VPASGDGGDGAEDADASDSSVRGSVTFPPPPLATDVGTARAGAPVGRRSMLLSVGGLLVGGMAGVSLARWRAPRVTAAEDGLPVAEVEVGTAWDVAVRIAEEGPLLLPDEDGRIAIVRWDPSYTSTPDGDAEDAEGEDPESRPRSALERYGPQGEDHPVLDPTTGLMALSLLSTHHGCLVRYCWSSGWFEDPCHGSRWNAWGEWTAGPAPRGLDRFGAEDRDGALVLDLTRHIGGAHREAWVLDQAPRGPACVE
jgi:cytochrome b6-f complex iron-sulfur subunit